MKNCSQEKRSKGSRVGQEDKREVRTCSQVKTSISLAPQKALKQEFHHMVGFPSRQGCQPFVSLCLSLATGCSQSVSGCLTYGIGHSWSAGAPSVGSGNQQSPGASWDLPSASHCRRGVTSAWVTGVLPYPSLLLLSDGD